MIGTGTIANVLAIIVGGSLGLLAKGGLKEHYQEGILKALGLATLFIGASGLWRGCWPRKTAFSPPPARAKPWP